MDRALAILRPADVAPELPREYQDVAAEPSMEDTSQPSNADDLSPRSATALRELEERARAAMSARRDEMSRLEAEISEQLDTITAALHEQRSSEASDGEQADEARTEAEQFRQETEAARAAWERERAEQEAELARTRLELQQLSAEQEVQSTHLAELCANLEARQADLDKQSAELAEREAAIDRRIEEMQTKRREQDAAQQQIEERQATWDAERATLQAKCDELLEQISQLEATGPSAPDGEDQLAGFEQKLQEQQASWNAQRDEWNDTRGKLEHERDELHQKFELALQDVQRFRGRAAELEQELARRPEANEADSAELVALRSERDALAERVEQLERQPAAPADGDSVQELSDLQRRFELAVEDVRELKTKNTELVAKLAAVGQRAVGQGDGGGMDWESQKRRMLASLDDEPSDGDAEREKERNTIQSTIEMTDAVVAEKDREIEELRTRLATATSEAVQASKDDHDEQVNDLLNADEIIAEHRKRIAQLEQEMQDKLRTAELELSVERAKLAREKVDLEGLRNDLEAQRQTYQPSGGSSSGTAPRRRWLSKLGLSGEEQ